MLLLLLMLNRRLGVRLGGLVSDGASGGVRIGDGEVELVVRRDPIKSSPSHFPSPRL